MTAKRRDDPNLQSHFRSDRVFENDGKWFFDTRENTVEGPFEDQLEATRQGMKYIERMTPGLQLTAEELSLEPFMRQFG